MRGWPLLQATAQGRRSPTPRLPPQQMPDWGAPSEHEHQWPPTVTALKAHLQQLHPRDRLSEEGGGGVRAKSNSRRQISLWKNFREPPGLCVVPPARVHNVYRWCARNSRGTLNFAWEITSQRLLDQSQAGVYMGKTPHTPPFWPFWAYSRTLPQGVELLV